VQEEDRDTLERLMDDITRLQSRVRILEGRLQDRALIVSDTKGQTRRVRLGPDKSLEVE